jgi:hypothetical protein
MTLLQDSQLLLHPCPLLLLLLLVCCLPGGWACRPAQLC